MALIPPQYLNAVVSIELDQPTEKNKIEKKSIATGFLFGKFAKKDEKTNESFYSIYLITNRHVFEDTDSNNFLKKVYLRFNLSENKGAKHFVMNLVDKEKKPIWIKHKKDEVDLAVIPLNGNKLRQEGIEFYPFRDDVDIFLAKDFEEKGIATGDGVFVLGFPLGLRGTIKNFAIVKKGIIARVDDEILQSHYYFIDSSAYPGNSGGPVIYKPEAVSILGTKAVSRAALIGVISEGITFRDVAISRQTNKPRIVFEEQTGLVKVVPVDLVIEVIHQYEETKGIPKQKEKITNEEIK